MKILIAANTDDGLYNFRRDLISRLLSDGHEVVLSVPDGDYRERLKNLGCTLLDIRIDRRGISVRKDFSLLLTYLRLLKKERPDLVVTYTVKPNVYCGLACRLRRIPYAVNITGLARRMKNAVCSCLSQSSCTASAAAGLRPSSRKTKGYAIS